MWKVKVRLFCYSVAFIVLWELRAFRIFIYVNYSVNVCFDDFPSPVYSAERTNEIDKCECLSNYIWT